jgi:tetratricopeptide (TPR) repeat protein
LARSSLSSADVQAAIASLQDLLAEAPSLVETRIYLATALRLQGRASEAIAMARNHINIYGETTRSTEAYALLGLLLEETGQFREALTAYKLAVRVQPAYAGAFVQPIVATDAQVRVVAGEVAKNPPDPLQRIRLGLLYEAKGRHGFGMEQFKAVLFTAAPPNAALGVSSSSAAQDVIIRTFPAGATVYLGDKVVGQSTVAVSHASGDSLQVRVVLPGFAEMKRTAWARRRSDMLFVLLPTLEAYGHTKFARDKITEGFQSYAGGDWPVGTRAFIEALESDYRLIKINIYIAAGYHMQGRVSESLDAVRRYINIKNDDATAMLAYALMGVIFEEQSRFAEALTGYKLALKLHTALAPVISLPPLMADNEIAAMQKLAQASDDPRLLFRLGAALEAKGRMQDGMTVLRRALFSLATL